jgi:hypothetical protein
MGRKWASCSVSLTGTYTPGGEPISPTLFGWGRIDELRAAPIYSDWYHEAIGGPLAADIPGRLEFVWDGARGKLRAYEYKRSSVSQTKLAEYDLREYSGTYLRGATSTTISATGL